MQKTKYFKGFTLVELIIVITILAILGSIAFVSFGVYSKNSRDSSRLSTMSTIQKGISLNQATTDKTILPDDYTEVYASGYLMGYEGIVGENVGRVIGLNSIPKDPKTRENYIYYTNKDRNKVQIMGFLEGEEMSYLGVNKAQAAGSGSKIPKVTGDNLGIILDSNYNRVTGTGIDILLSNSLTIYTTYFSSTDTVTSSGKDLYSKIYNRRSDLLNDKSLASLDDSLVGYWDMETLSGGKLDDLSKNNNFGTLSGGIIVGGLDGAKGKATLFNGNSTHFQISPTSDYSSMKEITLSSWVKFSKDPSGTVQEIFMKWLGWTYGYNVNGFWFELYSPGGGYIGTFNDLWKPKVGEWYNIVSVYDGKSMRTYINGKLLKDNTEALDNMTIYNNSSTNRIGIGIAGWEGVGFGNDGRYFDGIIDELRIYNRALSDSEIHQLYSLGK